MNRLSIKDENLTKIPFYVELHLEIVPGTLELEEFGQVVIAGNFEKELLERFIHKVHKWGGSFRNLKKVISSSRLGCFKTALKELDQTPPHIERALETITLVHGLGISYGSKHLRFLRPDICPILDQVMWENFHYPWSSAGYRMYQIDNMEVARRLEEKEITNPIKRADNKWFAGDVDMAIFAYLQHSSGKSGW